MFAARFQNPELIIDCATLTGGLKNALGNDYYGIIELWWWASIKH